MTPYQKAGFNELSLFRVVDGDAVMKNGTICWLTRDDDTTSPYFVSNATGSHPMELDEELQELPKDADGFYLWDGGECPVPGDWVVDLDQVSIGAVDYAKNFHWAHVTRFKAVSRPDMPTITGCAFSEKGDVGVHLSPTLNKNEQVEIVNEPDMPSTRKEVLDTLVQQAQKDGEYSSALDVQEGGEHYKKLKIQPMEYSMANKLDPCQHTIIKYVTRFRDKGGIEDLRKAKHCIDMLIEFEAEALEGGE